MTARKWVFRDTIDVQAKPVPERQPKPRRSWESIAIIVVSMTGAVFEFLLSIAAIDTFGVPDGLATSMVMAFLGVSLLMIGMRNH